MALVSAGVLFVPLFERLSLGAQLAVELLVMSVWPAYLIVANFADYARDAFGLVALVAGCVTLNALIYGVVFAGAGFVADTARRLRRL